MQHISIYSIVVVACLLMPVFASADKLGSVKVFKTYFDNPEIEMTLVRLGEQKERQVLAFFNTPGFSINGEYNVYKGQCETTRCNTIIYKVIGGNSRNFVSENGYFGDYFEVLLPGRSKPLAVRYEEKLSKEVKASDIYAKYLSSVGRAKAGNYNKDEITRSLSAALVEMQAACKSTTEVRQNIDIFTQKKRLHLVGMGAHYLKEIALKCADVDYQEELVKIKTVNLLPESSRKIMELKGNELFVYLSEKNYNPKYEAKRWLDNL